MIFLFSFLEQGYLKILFQDLLHSILNFLNYKVLMLNKELYLDNDSSLTEIEKDLLRKLLIKDYKKRITII